MYIQHESLPGDVQCPRGADALELPGKGVSRIGGVDCWVHLHAEIVFGALRPCSRNRLRSRKGQTMWAVNMNLRQDNTPFREGKKRMLEPP